MAEFYGGSADHWRSWLTIEVVGEGDTYATIRFRGGPQAESWGFDIASGITTTLRWTNDGGAHSGSGGLHSATGQSGWSTLADCTDTFEKHHDARTISASAETVNASGWRNGTSTASGSVQIGARAHHTWNFDANGGSGAPGPVTKWVGEHGYMPTQAPTRGVGWKFAGWSTDKSAASATYSAGGECTDDSDLTFYAVWERTYLLPTVSVTDARRTDANGSADPFGDHGLASFSWAVDRGVDAGNAAASVRLRHRQAGATDWAEGPASASGASGTCSKLVVADTGSAYEVQCEVTDRHGLSSTATAVIPVATMPIDVGSGGASVGIGVAAPASPGVAIGTPVSFADPAASRRALGLPDYGPVSPPSPYGSLALCVRAGVATLRVSWGTTADPWAKMQCGEWVVPEAYRPRMDLIAPVALDNRGTGDTGDTWIIVEASTGRVLWQNRGGGHSATTLSALVSWGIG
jgi:hypothetical protein